MKRKLFCEISPFTYWISKKKNIFQRNIKDIFSKTPFAVKKAGEKLPYLVFCHKSVIMRTLGNVDMRLQENKKTNLSLTVPKLNGVLIYPGEVFSFWKLVGNCGIKEGYKEGLTISNSKVSSGIGGGMCQFTNLIHWMALHSPLEIIEHHHHDGFDLFPDSERTVPFGTGTSITYNYMDYRIKNTTDKVFQFYFYLTDTHLCGELRSSDEIDFEYKIESKNEHFQKEEDGIYRVGSVIRTCYDKVNGKVLFSECIRENHAKVLYELNPEERMKTI